MSQQYGINRFTVIFDFRETKISREFLASEAIKRTLYMEEEVIIIASKLRGRKHVSF